MNSKRLQNTGLQHTACNYARSNWRQILDTFCTSHLASNLDLYLVREGGKCRPAGLGQGKKDLLGKVRLDLFEVMRDIKD